MDTQFVVRGPPFCVSRDFPRAMCVDFGHNCSLRWLRSSCCVVYSCCILLSESERLRRCGSCSPVRQTRCILLVWPSVTTARGHLRACRCFPKIRVRPVYKCTFETNGGFLLFRLSARSVRGAVRVVQEEVVPSGTVGFDDSCVYQSLCTVGRRWVETSDSCSYLTRHSNPAGRTPS